VHAHNVNAGALSRLTSVPRDPATTERRAAQEPLPLPAGSAGHGGVVVVTTCRTWIRLPLQSSPVRRHRTQRITVVASGKFGANAAWFRLNVLTYNLLTAL